jgi:hypothetical protein
MVPVLFVFYIQGVLQLKKNSGAKTLIEKEKNIFYHNLLQNLNQSIAHNSDIIKINHAVDALIYVFISLGGSKVIVC